MEKNRILKRLEKVMITKIKFFHLPTALKTQTVFNMVLKENVFCCCREKLLQKYS